MSSDESLVRAVKTGQADDIPLLQYDAVRLYVCSTFTGKSNVVHAL